MIKNFLIALIMLLTCRSVLGQQANYRTSVDTLKVFDNRILANCKTFMNESLIEESIAYLYPVTHKAPRFRLIGNLIQKDIEMDSIVRHGVTKKYFENRLIETAEFVNGKEVSVFYYDQKGAEISKEKYLNTYNLREPCGVMAGKYLISGQKKKKNK